ncbi:type II secretion system protein GspL [Sessilibacter sp. MAH4]
MNRIIAIYDSSIAGQNPQSPALTWRLAQDGDWMGPAMQGSATDLSQAQSAANAEVWLALSSCDLVMLAQSFSSKEKRHIANLMPYELEEQIIGNVDNMHFAYGQFENDIVTVAYTPIDPLKTLIDTIESAGAEITVCLPLFLLLPRADKQWAIRWLGDESLVEVRYDKDLGYLIELDMLAASLESLAATFEEAERPTEVKLYGQSFEDLQTLHNHLPNAYQEIATSQQWDQWLSLSMELLPPINLRQYALGRALPVARWWKTWRPAAIAAAIACVLYLGGNWVQIFQLKSEQKAYLAQVEQAYRSAVPQGVMADPERQLRNQLAKFKDNSSAGGLSVTTLLAQITPIIAASENVVVKNINFVEGDMRLTAESSNFQQIDRLRAELEGSQLVAELQGTSSVPNGVQARLRIRSGQ